MSVLDMPLWLVVVGWLYRRIAKNARPTNVQTIEEIHARESMAYDEILRDRIADTSRISVALWEIVMKQKVAASEHFHILRSAGINEIVIIRRDQD